MAWVARNIAADIVAAAGDVSVGDGPQRARLLPCLNVLAVGALAAHSAATQSLPWSTCLWAARTATPVARRRSRLKPCPASCGWRSAVVAVVLLVGTLGLLARWFVCVICFSFRPHRSLVRGSPSLPRSLSRTESLRGR